MKQWIIDLIRNEYDKAPDLGCASYLAFEKEWDDGAERIADKIIERFAPLYLAIRNSDDAHWTTAMRAAMADTESAFPRGGVSSLTKPKED